MALGNVNQVARLFRGQRVGASVTWASLTGKTQASLGGSGTIGVGGTTSNSGPHTDTRSLAWVRGADEGADEGSKYLIFLLFRVFHLCFRAQDYKNGWLLTTNDGGLYYRTTPKLNAGDWFSLNSNLGIQELVSSTYDPATGTICGGAQVRVVCRDGFVSSRSWT